MVSDMFYCGNALMEFDAFQRFIVSFIYTELIDGRIRIQEFRPLEFLLMGWFNDLNSTKNCE